MTDARNFITLAATVVLLLAAGTACAIDERDAPSATSSGSTSSQSPTATDRPRTESQIATDAAADVVPRYFATVDRLGQQPSLSLEQLARVAASIQFSAQKTSLTGQRREGLRQVGNTRIRDLQVQSVSLDNSNPDAGKVPVVVIDVCWDVTEVDIVDDSGKSVVSPSRPDKGWTRFTVANYRWEKNRVGGWRVASGQDLEQSPCGS